MSGDETQEQKQAEPLVAKAPTTGLSPLWTTVILSALVVAFVAAIMVILAAENAQRLSKEVLAQSKTLQTLQDNQQRLDGQLSQHQQSLHAAMASLEQLRLATDKDHAGSVLVEVDYLVRLAQYNAQYVGDAKIALALLETAEQRVSSLSSPQLADVRAALVGDITTLKGVKPVDAEGLMLRLNALSDSIVELPIVMQVMPEKATESAEGAAAPLAANNWKEKLLSSAESLKKVVVIRHLAEPVMPLIAPDQHSNLVGNIQLKLSLAQWALVHREPKIYNVAIMQAKEWVQRYFQANDMTHAVIAGLDELAKVDIKPVLPDLAPTVVVTNNAMEAHQHTVAPAAAVGVPSSEQSAVPEGSSGAVVPGRSKSGSAGSATPGSSVGPPAPGTPPKVKPENSPEPEVISS
jgi:uroporphyrin-3 C-methyltransferase